MKIKIRNLKDRQTNTSIIMNNMLIDSSLKLFPSD